MRKGLWLGAAGAVLVLQVACSSPAKVSGSMNAGAPTVESKTVKCVTAEQGATMGVEIHTEHGDRISVSNELGLGNVVVNVHFEDLDKSFLLVKDQCKVLQAKLDGTNKDSMSGSVKFDCDIPYTGHLDANIQFHGCNGEP